MGIGRRRKGRRTTGRIPSLAIAFGLLLGMAAIVGYLSCGPRDAPPATPTSADDRAAGSLVVRVRVLARADLVRLVVAGEPRTVRAADVPPDAPMSFDGASGTPVSVNGRRYRGSMRLLRIEGGIDVVNVVTIDDYLQGVVPSEAYPSWPDESLKAQAIASRTYALYTARSRPAGDAGDRGWDLHADVRSQAYGGIDAEVDATNRAVRETRGMVLTSGPTGRERIFSAYFSSTCGGVTASGADLFDDDTPALAAHVSDGCSDAPRYRWPEFAIRKDELTRRIKVWAGRTNNAIAGIGRVRSVEIAARNGLGRPVRFAVVDDGGRRVELPAEQFRNACNADRPDGQPEFFSSFFEPVDAGDSVRITEGKGWGHGVGLCQYCTAGWARRGWSHEQILAASYPGVVLVRAY